MSEIPDVPSAHLYRAWITLHRLKENQIEHLVRVRKNHPDDARAIVYFSDRLKKVAECLEVLNTFELGGWVRREMTPEERVEMRRGREFEIVFREEEKKP